MPYNGETVLVVDDDDLCRLLTVRCVQKAFPGATVVEAKDGEEGVIAFLEKFPFLTVTDLNMPVMDGREVVKRIKKIREDAKVVIMTGNALEAVHKEVDGFFRKGVSDHEIIRILHSAAVRS